jgi:uncharacterized protein (TIGR02118 family)
MIKSISLLTRREGMGHEEFIRQWVHEHAPLAHDVPGLRRYVLSPVSAQPGRPDVAAHGIAIDGVAELWYDDVASMTHALASPEMRVLRDHGAKIIGRATTCITEEIEIIARGA